VVEVVVVVAAAVAVAEWIPSAPPESRSPPAQSTPWPELRVEIAGEVAEKKFSEPMHSEPPELR
jgi:hypothetical protein